MKVIDTFIFYNELDMLEFRLTELDEFVDHFVIVEANTTFAGNPKELVFQKHQERFAKWSEKIKHIVVIDMPTTGNAWSREYHQRNSIDRGINELNPSADDIIIISDVDEIPDTNMISRQKETLTKAMSLSQHMFYYNLECRGSVPWFLAKIMPYKVYKTRTPQAHRSGRYPALTNGGWHFSYFGSADFIVNKIQQFSHQELNTPQYTNKAVIKKRIEGCQDLFGRGNQGGPHGFKRVPIDQNTYLPKHYKMLA